jgi:hypothetical protein
MDGADETRVLSIVPERAAHQGDRAREHALGREHVRPEPVEQLFFRHHLPVAFDEVAQHADRLPLERHRLLHPIEHVLFERQSEFSEVVRSVRRCGPFERHGRTAGHAGHERPAHVGGRLEAFLCLLRH